MPDIDQIIERMEDYVNQMEAAQKLVIDSAEQVKTLQTSASGVVQRAETDFKAISDKHQELIGTMTLISEKLQGFDFPDLKRELQEVKDQILQQGRLNLQGISLLETQLKGLETVLSEAQQLLQSRLGEMGKELSVQLEEQLEEEKKWMEVKWRESDQKITTFQQGFELFQQTQEKRQRQNNTWLIVLIVLAALLLGLTIYGLFRNPTQQLKPEAMVSEGTEKLEEKPEASLSNSKTPASEPKPALLSPADARNAIKDIHANALNRIKSQSFERLAEKYWDPTGVEFFPFGLSSSGKKFSLDELKTIASNPQVFQWGNGPDGKQLELTFPAYFKQFVNDQDFTKATSIHYNEITLPGKFNLSTDALTLHFGSCIFVEYVVGEESLVLVFGDSKQVKGVVKGG